MIKIVKDLHLPRFTLEKYVSNYCNIKTMTQVRDSQGPLPDTKANMVGGLLITYKLITEKLITARLIT